MQSGFVFDNPNATKSCGCGTSLPPKWNYFEFFELPQADHRPGDLEKRFYALSRQWHPDRFARAGAEEQQEALDATALLNDAYRTLRDPVPRAEYLLSSKGMDSPSSDAKDVPPSFSKKSSS